jgi:hypothetical protein
MATSKFNSQLSEQELCAVVGGMNAGSSSSGIRNIGVLSRSNSTLSTVSTVKSSSSTESSPKKSVVTKFKEHYKRNRTPYEKTGATTLYAAPGGAIAGDNAGKS